MKILRNRCEVFSLAVHIPPNYLTVLEAKECPILLLFEPLSLEFSL